MAKVKIRMKDSEIEVDSRDFYVDNQSVGKVIEEVSRHLQTASAGPAGGDGTVEPAPATGFLDELDEAEVHEPEFRDPVRVPDTQIRSKLKVLQKDAFFDKPRTAAETVGQLREYGWVAGPLDVSKALARMALQKELQKDSQNKRSYYHSTCRVATAPTNPA